MQPTLITLAVFAFLWGASFGSFLNVVIYRLPRGMSLSHPGSHCCTCQAPIRWYDNIPILSYFILRGRCRRCHSPYSPRYMIIEAASGVISLTLFKIFCETPLLSFEDPLDALDYFPVALCSWAYFLAFSLILIALAFIDLENTFLPDEITLPFLLIGLLGAFLHPRLDGLEHLIGAAVGALLLGMVALLGRLLYHREALGQGDIKFLAMILAFLGWKPLPFILFAAAAQSLLAFAITRIYHGVTGKKSGLTMTTEELDARFGETTPENAHTHTAIPFGPFLSLAALEALFLGEAVTGRLFTLLTLWLG